MTATVAQFDAIVAAGGSALALNRQRNRASQEKPGTDPPDPNTQPAILRLYRQAKEGTVMEPWHRRTPSEAHSDAYLAGKRFVQLPGSLRALSHEEWRELHPEDGERACREARRRAASKVRRYCRHHRLCYLWTLTYAAPRRRLVDVIRDVANLLRQLRRHFGALPLVVVAEPHPGGHGWHLHLAAGRFLPRKTVARACWPHGRIDVQSSRKRGQSPKKVAAYLQKYVAKGFAADDGAEPVGVEGHDTKGRRRYWCSRGPRGGSFVPQPEVYLVRDREEGRILGAVLLRTGPRAHIAKTIHLDRKPDYYGPPGCWVDYW